MSFSLRKSFIKVAIPAVLVVAASLAVEDYLLPEGYSVVDDIKLAAYGGQCIYAGRTDNLESDAQKSLDGLFRKASQSQTGNSILDSARAKGTLICYSKSLDEADECGSITIGVNYGGGLNLVSLNPNPVYRSELVETLVHETRHGQQRDMAFKAAGNGNFKESDLMIENWLREADARLVEIVFAYEMEQKGEGEYMKRLRTSNGYAHMVTALTGALDDGLDMVLAMRKTIRAFRDNEALARIYDNNALQYLEAIGYEFDADERADILISDDAFMQMGKIGNYDNYMDKELMAFIRNSVSYEDFKELSALRAQSGGTKGAACGQSKPVPKPTS